MLSLHRKLLGERPKVAADCAKSASSQDMLALTTMEQHAEYAE